MFLIHQPLAYSTNQPTCTYGCSKTKRKVVCVCVCTQRNLMQQVVIFLKTKLVYWSVYEKKKQLKTLSVWSQSSQIHVCVQSWQLECVQQSYIQAANAANTVPFFDLFIESRLSKGIGLYWTAMQYRSPHSFSINTISFTYNKCYWTINTRVHWGFVANVCTCMFE